MTTAADEDYPLSTASRQMQNKHLRLHAFEILGLGNDSSDSKGRRVEIEAKRRELKKHHSNKVAVMSTDHCNMVSIDALLLVYT